MNILIVDRDPAVVDQMQRDYNIDPRRDHVKRVSRPEYILGLDLTGWLVMTQRCHFVCNSFTARTPVKRIAEHAELCATQIANEQLSNILANIAKCKTRKGMNAIIATI